MVCVQLFVAKISVTVLMQRLQNNSVRHLDGALGTVNEQFWTKVTTTPGRRISGCMLSHPTPLPCLSVCLSVRLCLELKNLRNS